MKTRDSGDSIFALVFFGALFAFIIFFVLPIALEKEARRMEIVEQHTYEHYVKPQQESRDHYPEYFFDADNLR